MMPKASYFIGSMSWFVSSSVVTPIKGVLVSFISFIYFIYMLDLLNLSG